MSDDRPNIARRYIAFWNEREPPDSLALLRMTFAAALVGNVLEQIGSGMVAELYALPAAGGVFDFAPPGERSPLSLFNYLTPTPAVVWALIAGQLLAAVLLLIGCLTRSAAVACYVLQLTLLSRIGIWSFGGDSIFRVFLFLIVLAPCGAAWSVDAWRRGRAESVPCWPRRLLIFQLTVVYVTTGLMKIGSTWSVFDGFSAVYLSLNLPGIARWPGDWAAWVYPLTQAGTFAAKWFEITFFLVPLGMFLRRPAPKRKPGLLRRLAARCDWRRGYIAVGLLFHVSLIVLFDLGLFSFAMIGLYPCLLTPEESRRLLERMAGFLARNREPAPSRTSTRA